MAERYGGKLTFEDGGSVAIDLEFESDVLSLSTDGKPVGTWPVKYCRVSRTGTGSFLLSIDGEKVVFSPNDVEPFALAAAQRFHASSLADRIGVIRDVGSTPEVVEEPAQPLQDDHAEVAPAGKAAVDWRTIGAVLAIVGILTISGLMAVMGGDDDVTATTATGGSAGVSTTASIAALPPMFSQRPAEFVAAWNTVASDFEVDALITEPLTIGRFEAQIAPFVSLQGTTDSVDDTIASVVIVIDPRGGTEDDQLAIAILGVAISVADPSLNAQGRREIMQELGLDVARPDLGGLDGEVDYPGIRYRLQYVSEFNSLLFTMMES